MTTPASILRESIQAVPAVKYALGLAGLASVIAIIRSFGLGYHVAVIGTVIMLLLMTLLVIFARLSSLAGPDFRLPALVFTWFSLTLVIAISLSMFLSVFFRWPVDLQNWIRPETSVSAPQPSGKERPSSTTIEAQVTQSNYPNVTAGMKGADIGSAESPALNSECPEITFMDASKYPIEYRKERRCVQ
jgi:hypothetical protein